MAKEDQRDRPFLPYRAYNTDNQLIYDYISTNFNSIKVQLEHAYSIECAGLAMFQFHKGTIRTKYHGCPTRKGYVSIP